MGLYAGVTRVWGQGLQRRLGKGRVWEVLATWHQRGKRQKLGGLCGGPIHWMGMGFWWGGTYLDTTALRRCQGQCWSGGLKRFRHPTTVNTCLCSCTCCPPLALQYSPCHPPHQHPPSSTSGLKHGSNGACMQWSVAVPPHNILVWLARMTWMAFQKDMHCELG